MTEHRQPEGRGGGASACVADPVSEEDEEGGGHDCEARAAGVEGINCGGCCGEKGEEEASTEPVYDAGVGGEEVGCCIGDGGEGEPLQSVRTGACITENNRLDVRPSSQQCSAESIAQAQTI